MKHQKHVISFMLIIIIITSLSILYSSNFFEDSENRTTLIVSSEGPTNLSDMVEVIQKDDFYEGYSNDTLKWMQSLGQKSVYTHTDKIVIMDEDGASKLPSEYVCDAYIDVYFSCNVICEKSLGTTKYSYDVLYVGNVEYIKNVTHYYEV